MELHLSHYNSFSLRCSSRYFRNCMQKYFWCTVSKPTGLLSCSRPAWQRSILCSLPAFPPEVQLKFKSKRELLCISSLAFVASVFNRNTLFEKQRVGRASGFRSEDKGLLLFLQSYCEPRPCLWEIRAAIRSGLVLLSPSP